MKSEPHRSPCLLKLPQEQIPWQENLLEAVSGRLNSVRELTVKCPVKRILLYTKCDSQAHGATTSQPPLNQLHSMWTLVLVAALERICRTLAALFANTILKKPTSS
mgnify:CR=1 FL=1